MKNNTTMPEPQQIPTMGLADYGAQGEPLMHVTSHSAAELLELAACLAGGIEQIAMRMHDDINDGDSIYCDEIQVVRFLGDSIRALTRQAARSFEGGAA